ncbi:hypothetical protein DMENIID0001_122470 [Sergentomyia squamirostris]
MPRRNPSQTPESTGAQSSAAPGAAVTDSCRLTVKDFALTLSKFSGATAEGPTAAEWLQEVDALGEIYGCGPKIRLFGASTNLEGAAEQWYKPKKASITTWEAFKTGLVAACPVVISQNEVLMKILNAKKDQNQTMDAYYQGVLALAAKTEITERQLKEALISGLPYFEWRVAMTPNLASSMEKFHEQLLYLEKLSPKEEKEPGKPPQDENAGKSPVEANSFKGKRSTRKFWRRKREKKEDDQPSQRVENKRKAENTSSAEEPPKKKVCFSCQQPGHFARECKKKRAKNKDEPKQDFRVQESYGKGHGAYQGQRDYLLYG